VTPQSGDTEMGIPAYATRAQGNLREAQALSSPLDELLPKLLLGALQI